MPKTPHSSLNLSSMLVASIDVSARFVEASGRSLECARSPCPDPLGLVDRHVDRRPRRRRRSETRCRRSGRSTRAGTPAAAARAQHVGSRRPARPRRRRATPTRRTAPRRRRARPAPPTTAAPARRHVGADAAGVEAALGQRHREPAVGAVVRRPHQAVGRAASTSSCCSARSRVEIERRRRRRARRPCTTFRYSLPPSSPRSSPSRTMASPARPGTRASATRRRVLEQPDDADDRRRIDRACRRSRCRG